MDENEKRIKSAANLENWKKSPYPLQFVVCHRGAWNHEDWSDLIGWWLPKSDFWPIELNQPELNLIGQALEQLKPTWQHHEQEVSRQFNIENDEYANQLFRWLGVLDFDGGPGLFAVSQNETIRMDGCQQTRKIGRHLNTFGGLDRMKEVSDRVKVFKDPQRTWLLQVCWHGIGNWKCPAKLRPEGAFSEKQLEELLYAVGGNIGCLLYGPVRRAQDRRGPIPPPGKWSL